MGSFCLRAVRFLQPHHTGRLQTQQKAQGGATMGATSRADAILIFRGVNLSVVHCMCAVSLASAGLLPDLLVKAAVKNAGEFSLFTICYIF